MADGVERWHAAAPLQRLGGRTTSPTPSSSSPPTAARWITGANLVVDGGVLAHNTW